MIKYYPYKSNKPNKNITLLQMTIKLFILMLVDIVSLPFIKMKHEYKDIWIETKKNEIWTKSGINMAG